MLQQVWGVLADPDKMQQAAQLAAAAQWEDGGVLRGTFARVYHDTIGPLEPSGVLDIHLAAATGNAAAVELALLLGLQPGSFPDSGVGEKLGLLGSCMPAFDQQGMPLRRYIGGEYSVEAVLPVVQLLGEHGWRVGGNEREGCHYGPACLDAALQLADPELLQALFLPDSKVEDSTALWGFKLCQVAHEQDRKQVQLLLDLMGRTSRDVGVSLIQAALKPDAVAVRELLAAGADPEAAAKLAGPSLLHRLALHPQNTQEQQVSLICVASCVDT
jgi:hypothetical protein